MATLPAEFSDLEPFSDWCLESERERYAKRLASDMGELQAFYDAAFPRLEAAIEHLEAYDLDALPDVPEPLAPLLQMQMAERPRSLDQWRHWLSAFTQEGYASAGAFSVLSIVVRPDLPARIALHLRPATIDAPPQGDRENGSTVWAGPESAAAWR